MGAVGLKTYIWNNNLRSTFLLAGFPVLLLGIVFVLTLGLTGGAVGQALALMEVSAPAAIVVSLVWFLIAYAFNQQIIDLATGARKLERSEAPQLFEVLENLCISRGLTMPALRIIEGDGMNAFASGVHEGRFSITVTRGLLASLDRDELEAVLGHELTHVNRDVRTMVIAAIFAGIITLVCQIIYRSLWWSGRGRGRGGAAFWLVAMAAAAIGSLLAIVIRMALSRTREYVADMGSVELTKNPDAMISALSKVSGHAHLDAPQSVRAMFLEDDDEGVFGLFATHPPVEKRIAALQKFAGGRIVEPTAAAPPAAEPGPSGPWGPHPGDPGDARPSGPWG